MTTNASKVQVFLSANPGATIAEIDAGTRLTVDVDVIIFDMVRVGQIVQSDGWDRVAKGFRYEVAR